jgi:ubiquinone/menaquinone biosynthesis C-methylase UbiE
MFADAEAYERFMGRWSRLLAPQLVAFAGTPDAGRVLDIGSGTGALAFAIAGARPRCQVVGIDPSKEYIAFATSKSRFPNRVAFEVGDAQKLHFPDAAFQTTLSLLVLNFIPDYRKALQEARRVTAPRGCVSAAVWDYGAGMRMLRVFWDSAKSIDPASSALDESHMPLCRAGDLEALWKEAGFESVTGRPLEITTAFDSFSDFWEPFSLGQGPAGAYLRGLDPPRREAVRNDVKRRSAIRSEQAPLQLRARAWAVRGIVPPPR